MSQAPIQKLVILTAGLGTRFFPVTKAIPKAMLPILDKPIIQLLVEEAESCGIKEIAIVISEGHESIIRHFTPNEGLEKILVTRGKTELIAEMQRVESMANFHFIVQDEPMGDGHALLCAQEFLGDEPFAVLFGDDLIDHETPALKQLLETYQSLGTPVLCTQEVKTEELSSYGVLDPGPNSENDKNLEIRGLVEKPTPAQAPSNWGIIGKYICTPQVLHTLKESQSSHPDGELRLIDAFIRMLRKGLPLHARKIQGTRFDTGSKEGWLAANLHYAKKDKILT